jgi:hypothetical protein
MNDNRPDTEVIREKGGKEIKVQKERLQETLVFSRVRVARDL